MITRNKTLKLIKEKVDGRTTGKVRLKKRVTSDVVCGVFRHKENKTIKDLFKRGNSVMCIDENYEIYNINELETKALQAILWQVITDKEKKEIAVEHLYSTFNHLKEIEN